MRKEKALRPKARLPRGLRDRGPAEFAAERRMLEIIRRVYESYGFEPLETPAIEYIEASRKLLDGVLEAANIDTSERGIVLRAIDKLDRLGLSGVQALLGGGRRDESGDFTTGAQLSDEQQARVLAFAAPAVNDGAFLGRY